MKLYLSSYRLGNNPQKLYELAGVNKKAAVIANSMDFLENPEDRKNSVQREIEDLESLGFEAEEVDLRNYFGKKADLAKKLSEFGLIWVRGGNVFVLKRAYKESGMGDWLVGQRSNPELVYGGYSAGVCILSPSLNGLEIVDNPEILPKGYKNELDWSGLGLINFAFAPHYMSNHPESEAINNVIEWYKEKRINYKAISDGEVIIREA